MARTVVVWDSSQASQALRLIQKLAVEAATEFEHGDLCRGLVICGKIAAIAQNLHVSFDKNETSDTEGSKK